MADGALSRNAGRTFFQTLSALIAPTPQQPKGVQQKAPQKAKAEPKLEYVTGTGQDTFETKTGSTEETRSFLGDALGASRDGVNRAAARAGARRMSNDPTIDPDEKGGSSQLFAGTGGSSIEARGEAAVDQAFNRVVSNEQNRALDDVAPAPSAHELGNAMAAGSTEAARDAAAPIRVNGGAYVNALRARRDDLQSYDGGSLLKPALAFAAPRPADALLGGGPGMRASDFAVPPSHPNAAAWREAKDWVSDTAHGLGVIPAIGTNTAEIGFYSDLVREKLR